MEYVLAFANTNSAIKAEHCLLQAAVAVSVMPLPSQIRAGCGICLRMAPQQIGDALRLLDAAGIKDIAIYSKALSGKESIYTKVQCPHEK